MATFFVGIFFIILLLLYLLAVLALFSLPPALIYFICRRKLPSGVAAYSVIIIAGICFLVTSTTFGLYDKAGDDHITVMKPLSAKLSNYYNVLLEEPQDIDMHDSPYFLLSNKGLNVSRSKKNFTPDLRVVVNSEDGLRPPTFIGHTPIPTFRKGLSRLTYTFINHKNNEIIGEVEYSRPFYKIEVPYIAELLFQKITEFKPGLTDFSEWSKVTMKESRIRIELPKEFCDYSDSSNKDNTWFSVDVEMHKLIDPYSYGVADSKLKITFKKETKEEFIDETNDNFSKTFQGYFTRHESPDGFQIEYRKDYEVDGGYVIRAHATRLKNIPNSYIPEDEKAIQRIMESLEVLGPNE